MGNLKPEKTSDLTSIVLPVLAEPGPENSDDGDGDGDNNCDNGGDSEHGYSLFLISWSLEVLFPHFLFRTFFYPLM